MNAADFLKTFELSFSILKWHVCIQSVHTPEVFICAHSVTVFINGPFQFMKQHVFPFKSTAFWIFVQRLLLENIMVHGASFANHQCFTIQMTWVKCRAQVKISWAHTLTPGIFRDKSEIRFIAAWFYCCCFAPEVSTVKSIANNDMLLSALCFHNSLNS